jgi:putative N6-adenine-specific DNA methylase
VYSCYAITTPGLEQLTARELTALGISPGEVEPGGVAFEATPAQLYAANLQLRTAGRVLVRVAAFPAKSFAELERKARKVEWGAWVPDGGAVHFRVTSRKSKLYHQDGIAERLERAVQEALPSVRAVRAPSEADLLDDDVTRPPMVQRFIVRVLRDELTLSADSSGALLYLRGYRQATGKAPLRETLAAAMLLASEWDAAAPLVDPMCGSGTIPIEAALLARRIPPGAKRHFAFERWPAFDAAVWDQVKRGAMAATLERAPATIIGADRDDGAIAAALANAERAGVAADIELVHAPISETVRRLSATESFRPSVFPSFRLLLTNPPYGHRVGDRARLRDLYASLGNALRGPLAGWRLAFLTADPVLARATGLELRKVLETTNGGLKVTLYGFPSSRGPIEHESHQGPHEIPSSRGPDGPEGSGDRVIEGR